MRRKKLEKILCNSCYNFKAIIYYDENIEFNIKINIDACLKNNNTYRQQI